MEMLLGDDPRGYQDDKRGHEKVDQKGINKRSRPPGNPSKRETTENGGERFQRGFSEVSQGKRHRLQPQGVVAELFFKLEIQPPAKDEFPTDEFQK